MVYLFLNHPPIKYSIKSYTDLLTDIRSVLAPKAGASIVDILAPLQIRMLCKHSLFLDTIMLWLLCNKNIQLVHI